MAAADGSASTGSPAASSGRARTGAAMPAADADDATTRPPWGGVGRVGTLALIGAVSKLYLHVLNSTSITGEEAFHKAALDRDPQQGLITVSNHTSTTDDPAVIAAMLPWSAFAAHRHLRSVRWSLCAREICFKNALLRQFFLNGQTLPIDRGQGTGQPIMKTAAGLVAGGAWVHVFPEGHVGYSGRLEPCRWGVGRLVCDAAVAAGRDPLVVPFYHTGMGIIQPRGSTLPRVGRQLHVTIGQPLPLGDLTCRCGRAGEDQQQVWMDITARVRAALADLETQSPPNNSQLRPGEAAWKEPTVRDRRDLKDADPVLPPSGVVR